MQQNKPLISVLIPAYNHENYIEECLDSIVNDSYPNKEILIINDGSSDNTDIVVLNWILKNKDRIPTKYKYRKNKGISRTINELVHMSKGEYIAVIASDDFIINNGLEKRYKYLAKNSDKLAVVGDAIVVDANNKVVSDSSLSYIRNMDRKRMQTDKGLRLEIISNWGMGGSTNMIHRDLFKVINDFDSSLIVEDWDFYLKIISKNLLGYLNEVVSAYRFLPNSVSKSKDKEALVYDNLAITARNNLKNFKGIEKLMLLGEFLQFRHKYKKLGSNSNSKVSLIVSDIFLKITKKFLKLSKKVVTWRLLPQ